jgi:hypothetical protein
MSIPVLSVKTLHSHYLIDQESGTYVRTRVHEKANDLSYAGIPDGEKQEYRDLVLPGVGECLMAIHPDGSYIRSTPVVSIDHLEN